jgi:hypothetical protein
MPVDHTEKGFERAIEHCLLTIAVAGFPRNFRTCRDKGFPSVICASSAGSLHMSQKRSIDAVRRLPNRE